jgi:tetratricopeptide (TPR) repeat protein
MNKVIIAICTFFIIGNVSKLQSQDFRKIDSLKQVLQTLPKLKGTDADTTRMKLCVSIGDLFKNFNGDSAIWWYTSVIDTNLSVKNIKMYSKKNTINATALRYIGSVLLNQRDYSVANSYFKNSLKIFEVIDNNSGASRCLYNMGIVAWNQNNFPVAILNFEKSIKIGEVVNDKLVISKCLVFLGLIAKNQSNLPLAISYFEKSLKISEELGDKSGILSSLEALGMNELSFGNYSVAKKYYERSLKISEELGDKSSSAKSLMNLGNVEMNQGNYPAAISYYERSLKVSEIRGDKLGISGCLNNLGLVEARQSNYIEAISYYERSLKICEELNDKRGIVGSLINIGSLNQRQSNYPAAICNYEKSLKINEEIGDELIVSKCLQNLGSVAYDKANYIAAISFFERSLSIADKKGNKPGIIVSLRALGDVASELGNNLAALTYYEKSLIIAEEIGEKLGISNCLMNIAAVNGNQKNYQVALSYFEKALEISEGIDDKVGTAYGLSNIGLMKSYQGDFHTAKLSVEKSLLIAEETVNKLQIATCLMNLGEFEDKQGKLLSANAYLERSLKKFEELGNKSTLASQYPILAKSYLKLNKPKEAYPLLLKSKKITINLLQENFSILSEKDKELYFEKSKTIFNDIHSFNLNYPKQTDTLSGICYNNELILKGLLLKSTQGILDVVYNSTDTTVKNAYFLLKQLRNQISLLQGIPMEERNQNIDSLEKAANEQERKLVKLSSEFANIQNLFSYKWEDVQKNLKPGEAAIEFVNFTQGKNNDTTIYAALLIRPDSKKPESIKLFEDHQLQNVLDLYGGSDFQKVLKLYGTNKIVNNELYKLIWQPLEQYLSGIKTVYFAPVGVLNKISFAALGNENQMLFDKYSLQQLSTTGKILNSKEVKKESYLIAAIFGGINYNPDTIKQELWQYLPGTLNEKEIIEKQFKKNKVTYQSFSNKEAKEDKFKELYNDSVIQPSILHIATHGFFYPDPEQIRKQIKNDIKADTGLVAFRGSSGFGNWMFVENKNPMMRSGLVFAGANKIWSEDWGRTDNEGVLTAYEVSNINMRNTELVVLSACETGLGDIKGSEGVYGLQRAFKMAGVKFIVMSLWQVPDKETVEFMETFYTKLLKQKDIRLAFTETQKVMRGKYDPYYWAAFVLVE